MDFREYLGEARKPKGPTYKWKNKDDFQDSDLQYDFNTAMDKAANQKVDPEPMGVIFMKPIDAKMEKVLKKFGLTLVEAFGKKDPKKKDSDEDSDDEDSDDDEKGDFKGKKAPPFKKKSK